MDPITEKLKLSYEEVPYDSLPHRKSHPDHLAAMAALCDIDAPPVDTARVLEIGCASGGNLLPIAEVLPNATLLGVDLSPRQIDAGQQAINEIKLQNVELRCLNLMDFPADVGEFDYIIAHGVYSWVPLPVRVKLLEVCRRHLSPNGIAYISYNTFPGWRYRQVAREMMLYAAEGAATQAERIKRGREFLALVANLILDGGPTRDALRSMEKGIAEFRDRYLAHDHMAEVNEPCYFSDFVRDAAGHGLRYLRDSEAEADQWHRLPGAAQEGISKLTADPVSREQYADFFVVRAFRSSLLCRADAIAKTRGKLIQKLFVASNQPETPLGNDAQGKPVIQFGTAPFKVGVSDPGAIAVLRELRNAWPSALPFSQLAETLSRNSPEYSDAKKAVDALIYLLQTYHRFVIIELFSRPWNEIAPVPPTWPRITRYARWQAENSPMVTTLRHQGMALDAPNRMLLSLLDGTRDLDALVQAVSKQLSSADEMNWPGDSLQRLSEIVRSGLKHFATHSLLIHTGEAS
jgi:SAM-dependent methyltransferase